jgi:hypothetical protein
MGKFNYYSFLCIKIIAIIFYSLIYFIIGFVSSLLLNKYIPITKQEEKEDNPKNIPILKLLVECILIFSFVSVIFFFLRKIIKHIPYPLQGISGFDKGLLKELNGVALLAPIFMTFQVKFVKKLSIIKKKLKL